MEQVEKKYIYKYSKDGFEKSLNEMLEQNEFPQFYRLTDDLYCYRYKGTCYIGTLEFFEQVDKEVRENIKKYGRLQQVDKE